MKEDTVRAMSSYSDNDLTDIVNDKKTQSEVKEEKSKGPRGQNTTYTLSRAQSARFASLSITLDERGKKLLTRVFDLGLKAGGGNGRLGQI